MQSNANELNPLENNSFKLTDLVDIGMLKELSEKFTEITGLTIGLFEYPDQTILFKTGWKKVCTDFHMAYPEAAKHCLICNRKLFDRLERQGQLVIEKCGNGMYDCATPIFIQDKLIACITTGQLLLEKPDRELHEIHYAQHEAEQHGQYLPHIFPALPRLFLSAMIHA